jgi:hypothetical protein
VTPSRSPALFCAAMVVFFAALLGLDRYSDERGQLALALATWIVLLAACRPLDPERRAQVALVIVVASCTEVVGSVFWGVYEYRLGNLPLFVPPAHGLVYLTGLRLSQTALVERRTRAFVAFVLAFALGWTIAGLTVLPREDVAGAIGAATFVACVVLGRARATYAGVFVAVAALEFYGTALGTWRWAEVVPGLGLPDGNPPSGVASGYVLFDVIAIALAPRVVALARRTDRLCGEMRLALRSVT